MSTAFFTRARESLLERGVAIAAIEVALSALLLAGIGYLLTWRLRAMIRTTEAIAGGDLEARAMVKGNGDEVDRLSSSFNSMAEALCDDIAARRRKERDLLHAVERLTEANSELERFAYVASHDLQEPLRTVVSFSQLLERKFAGRLGEDGEEYLRFVVGASTRMHQLINDLLDLFPDRRRPSLHPDLGRGRLHRRHREPPRRHR